MHSTVNSFRSMGWISVAIAAWPFVAGCATAPRTFAPPLDQRTIVLDQLIVHSDFDLPREHRLLEELRAVRGDMAAKLELPTSNVPVHVHLFRSEVEFAAFSAARFPEYPARRAFFINDDSRLAIYAFWGDRAAEDLRHEVTHGYLHSVVPSLPLWLDEGLAEYYEAPRLARGLNRPHVDLLLAAYDERKWRPNIDRLAQLDSAAHMTQLDYAESWAWTHLLLETTDDRRALVTGYLRAIREQPKTLPLSIAIRRHIPTAEETLVQHLRWLAERDRAGHSPAAN